MPDEPQVIDTPVETPDQSQFYNDAGARFEEGVKAAESKVTEKAAAAPQKPAEAPKPETGADIPDEVLTGEKAVKKEEVEEDIPTPEFRKPETRKHWDDLKGRYVATKTKLQTAEARLADLEKRASAPVDTSKFEEELKTYRSRTSELEAALEKAAFQESPRYKGFLEKEQTNVETAKGVIDGSEVDASVIDTAAAQKPAQRIKTLKEAGLEPEQIAAILPYLAQNDLIRKDREKALEGYKDELARENAAQAQRQEQARAQQKEKDGQTFKKVLDFAAEKFMPFRRVEGADAWNAEVEKSIERARAIFEGGELPDDDIAMVAFKAAGFETQQGIIVKLQGRLKELQTRVSELTAAQPDLKGGNKDGRQNQTVDPDAPFSYDEAGERFAQDPRLQR